MRAAAATAALVLLLTPAIMAGEAGDAWEPVRFLEGRWAGPGGGKSGVSLTEREYGFVLGGRYLRATSRSVFKPQEKNPEGEVHENIDFLSYDSGRGKIVLRQFHSEGFTNRYVLETVSEDGSRLVFVTEDIENGPPGMSARLVIERHGADAFSERFELSMGGGEYSCLITNTLKRVE